MSPHLSIKASSWHRFYIPGKVRGSDRPRARRLGARGIQLYSTDANITEAAWIRSCFVQAYGNPHLLSAIQVDIEVIVEPPASWSDKKRQAALRGEVMPIGKPDVDNIAKLQMDALKGLLWRDDTQVTDLSVRKRYGTAPGAWFAFWPYDHTLKGSVPPRSA